jgi:rubrerythrin
MRCPIATVEEFYAHALAIEHEAAQRYGEFATYFSDRGEEVLAGLCRNLAVLEDGHYHQLVRAAQGLTLPAINEDRYHWLDPGAPETALRELMYRVAQPGQLLQVALESERRARDFFAWVARSAASATVRELAAVMAADEGEHVHWVKDALDYHQGPPAGERPTPRGTGPGPTVD